MTECSTCSCEFSLEDEGGIAGNFGILPVAFCPTCLSSVFDMVDQLKGYDDMDDLDVTKYEAKAGDEDSFSNLD